MHVEDATHWHEWGGKFREACDDTESQNHAAHNNARASTKESDHVMNVVLNRTTCFVCNQKNTDDEVHTQIGWEKENANEFPLVAIINAKVIEEAGVR